MNTRLFFTGMVLVFLFTQCGDSPSRDNAQMEVSDMEAPAAQGFASKRAMEDGQSQPVQTDPSIERKLIREGNMRFETTDVAKTRSFLDSLVTAFGGYLANENIYNYEGTLEQNISVRIPSEQFDPFLAAVSSYAGRLDNRYINTLDVTEEFIDVEARLKSKKQLEQRYLELLKQARTVEDMVAIETQLSQVRSEIESMEGRLKYLQNRVSFASLSISFYQTKTEGFGFWDKIGDGWGNGWDKFLGFMVWLVTLWPFMLLIVLVIVIFRVRRARKRNSPD